MAEGLPATRSPAKIATSPTPPCGSWRARRRWNSAARRRAVRAERDRLAAYWRVPVEREPRMMPLVSRQLADRPNVCPHELLQRVERHLCLPGAVLRLAEAAAVLPFRGGGD